jgi:predicted lipoprotein with Yx(FWY)xxD motif
MTRMKAVLLGGLAMSGLLAASGAGAASPAAVPYSTPAGITIVNASKLTDHGIPQFMFRRLGDGAGNPLYTFDADKANVSSCYNECAVEFPPFVAAADAQAEGDFTILSRKDGVRQWAYQGKPLHRYSGKDPVGEPIGQRFQLREDPTWSDPASSVHSPKQGWRRATFTPEKTMLMPPDVQITGLALASGFAFSQTSTKMTVYAAAPSKKLSIEWNPLRASALAMPVGDFTIVKNPDGSRQWSYRGELLYTFAGDYAPAEAEGLLADKEVHVALAYKNFQPENVTVGQYLHGPLLTTANGQSLYTNMRYKLSYGGTESRATYGVSYYDAKVLGSMGCQGECLQTWQPLAAPANAQSRGYWEVHTRADGAKQWSFKGSPLYTYVGDTKPGDNNGNNRHVVVFGGANGQVVYGNPGNDLKSPQAHLGALKMSEVDPGGRTFGGRPPAVASTSETQGAATGNAPATAAPPRESRDVSVAEKQAKGIPANANGLNDDYAPGFYWHSAGVFY